MKASVFSIIALFILIGGCSVNWTIPNESITSISAADKQLIDDMFEAFSGNKPGASVMIAKGNELVYCKSYGLSNRETLAVPTCNTNYRIGSVSKQFTAMGILILVDQGKLDLESKLVDVFPDFPAYGKNITIQQLLTHQSGLPNYMAFNSRTDGSPMMDEDVMKFLKQRDALIFEAGSQIRYSNTGYALLALIIEEVTGQSFDSYMKRAIFEPVGMDNTVFNSIDDDIPYRAYGNRIDNGKIIFQDQSFSSYIKGDGSIYTSVNDYFKWHLALNEGKLISKSLQERAYTAQAGTNEGYGYGWFTPDDKNGIKWVRHGGSTAGFLTQSVRIPGENITVAFFTNRGQSSSDLASQHLGIRAEALLSIATEGRFPMPDIKKQLQSESKKSMGSALLEKIRSNGQADGLEFYNKHKNDNSYYLDHAEMTDAAYAMIQENLHYEGLEVLKLIERDFPEIKERVNTGVVIDVSEQLSEYELMDKAHAYADFLMEAYPEQERSWRAKAQVYHKEGKFDSAVKYYTKSAELNPKPSLFQIAFLESKPYQRTVLPIDTTSLFETRGDLAADTAYLFVMGGPMLDLEIGRYDPLKDLPNHNNYLRVYPYQTQMLHPELTICSPPMNREQGLFELERTSEIVERTVNYFKKRGKVVYIIGHSFGLTISLDYLLNHENNADHIVLMAGHFNTDPRNMDREPGKIVRWKNGEETYQRAFYRIEDDFPKKPQLNNVLDNIDALLRHARARQYTDLLKDADLSDITFVHSRFEEASGRSNTAELEFAKRKGIGILESFGDHHSMLQPHYLASVYNHIVKEVPLKHSVAGALSNIIETDGIELAVQKFNSMVDSDKYMAIDESEMNTLGYYLMEKEKLEDAIEIFKLNIRSFPQSWNVYDSIGEAYLKAGDKTNSKYNYEKSLELNPKNTYALEALKTLQD